MTVRKAVILAGGLGTRLHPVTLATNKHLLPLFNKPVIWHAVDKLVEAGITNIMIVTHATHINNFAHVLGSGQHWKPKYGNAKQIQITYGIQNAASGIVDGLYIAKEYVGNEPCILFLGDNYIEDDLEPHLKNFAGGATVFLKEVKDPERFGVATISKDGTVTSIVEKPKNPKSNLAVIGLYIFDESVFDKMIGQKPSARGEYEVTHINNKYLKEGTLRAVTLEKEWFDIGTFESLLEASAHVHKKYRDTPLAGKGLLKKSKKR